MENSNSKAKSLNPIFDLDEKHNYQKFFLIEKDGTIKERVILFISNIELREQIICIHFLNRYVQFFIEKPTGVKFLSRDKPWDFEIELSNSEYLTIEITSIADEENLFRNFKSQERISEKSNYPQIEFHELKKLNILFPDEHIKQVIEKLDRNGVLKNQLVENPHFGKKFIFESSINEDLKGFDELLKTSINKKIQKNHQNKEDVVLIIDNRTVTYQLEEIIKYLENMNGYFEKLPFKEIWLYTGYYSNLDGSNAEFSIVPLKLNEIKLEKITSKLS